MWGSYYAQVEGTTMEGDYRLSREPRLRLELDNGFFNCYSSSLKLIEDTEIEKSYDFTIDILSKKWSDSKAFENIKSYPQEIIADVLMDQTIFSGVGNIIKNEVLFLTNTNPLTPISKLSDQKIKDIIEETKSFSRNFYTWRKLYQLNKHLKIYKKGTCSVCGTKIIRGKLGKRERMTYYCPACQPAITI
jgi:endonuclease-8